MKNNSFEKFYYEKIALGEGCGCAEQIISAYDLDRRSREAAMQKKLPENDSGCRSWFSRLFRQPGRR